MPLALNSEGQTGNQIHHSQPFSSLQPCESHRSRDISFEPSVLYSEDKNEYTRYTRRCLSRAGKWFCLGLLKDRFSRCSFLSASAKPSLKCIYFHSFKKETYSQGCSAGRISQVLPGNTQRCRENWNSDYTGGGGGYRLGFLSYVCILQPLVCKAAGS